MQKGTGKAGKEALEAGAKRSTAEVLEQLAKHEGGDLAKVVTKNADEIAEEAAKEAAERWAKLGYDDLGKTAPCFLAGTFVHTTVGLVSIENVKIGDVVFCYDRLTKNTVKNKVVNIYKNWTDKFIKITTDKDVINTTFKHLFWIEKEEKWITAKELKTDMILKSLFLKNTLIKNIDYENNVNLFTYNIEVEKSHNYFVGNHGILVHNDNKPSKFESTTKKPIKIYEVYDTRTGEVKYVGQTDKPSVQDRFNEHLNSKDTKKIDRAQWNKHYDIREVHSGNWDPYEASVWEQHYMEKNGGKPNLENRRNEVTKAKYDKYKNLYNPC